MTIFFLFKGKDLFRLCEASLFFALTSEIEQYI